MYTNKNFQGQGIASAILKKLEEELTLLRSTYKVLFPLQL